MGHAANLAEEVFEVVPGNATTLLLRMEEVSARVHLQSLKLAIHTSVQVKSLTIRVYLYGY